MQEVEVASDVAITVVYKSDGGSVSGTAENCASGGVLLVPTTRPGGGRDSPDPAPAIPTAITKFARCAPAITMRWPSPGTARW